MTRKEFVQTVLLSVFSVNSMALIFRFLSTKKITCRPPLFVKYALRIWNLIMLVLIIFANDYLSYSSTISLVLMLTGFLVGEYNNHMAYIIIFSTKYMNEVT